MHYDCKHYGSACKASLTRLLRDSNTGFHSQGFLAICTLVAIDPFTNRTSQKNFRDYSRSLCECRWGFGSLTVERTSAYSVPRVETVGLLQNHKIKLPEFQIRHCKNRSEKSNVTRWARIEHYLTNLSQFKR